MPRKRRVDTAVDDPIARAELSDALHRDPIFIAAQAVLALKLVLVVLLFDPNIIDAFALPKSAATHVTTAVLVVLLAALLVAYGRRILIWSPLHVAVGDGRPARRLADRRPGTGQPATSGRP